VTEHGFGKRTKLNEFRNKHRAGQGVVLIPTEDRNGPVVAAREVIETDEVMMITRKGMIIRCPVRGIRCIGRAGQGVKVINLKKGDSLVDVALIAGEKDENGIGGDETGPGEDDVEPIVQDVVEEMVEEEAEPEAAPKAEPETKTGPKARKKPAAGKKEKGGK